MISRSTASCVMLPPFIRQVLKRMLREVVPALIHGSQRYSSPQQQPARSHCTVNLHVMNAACSGLHPRIAVSSFMTFSMKAFSTKDRHCGHVVAAINGRHCHTIENVFHCYRASSLTRKLPVSKCLSPLLMLALSVYCSSSIADDHRLSERVLDNHRFACVKPEPKVWHDKALVCSTS